MHTLVPSHKTHPLSNRRYKLNPLSQPISRFASLIADGWVRGVEEPWEVIKKLHAHNHPLASLLAHLIQIHTYESRPRLYDTIGEVGFAYWKGSLGAALWDYFSWKVEEFEVGDGLFKQVERRKHLTFHPSRSNCKVSGFVVNLGALPSLLKACLRLAEGGECNEIIEAVRKYVNVGEEGGLLAEAKEEKDAWVNKGGGGLGKSIPRPQDGGQRVEDDKETYLGILVSHYSNSKVSSPSLYISLFSMGLKLKDCKSFELAVSAPESSGWGREWGTNWKGWAGMIRGESQEERGVRSSVAKEFYRRYGSESSVRDILDTSVPRSMLTEIRVYRALLLSHLSSTLASPDLEFGSEMVSELRSGLGGTSGGVTESMFKGFVAVVGRCVGEKKAEDVRNGLLEVVKLHDLKPNLVKPLLSTCLGGKKTFDASDVSVTKDWVGRVKGWWDGGRGEWSREGEVEGGTRFMSAEAWGAFGMCYLAHLPNVIGEGGRGVKAASLASCLVCDERRESQKA